MFMTESADWLLDGGVQTLETLYTLQTLQTLSFQTGIIYDQNLLLRNLLI